MYTASVFMLQKTNFFQFVPQGAKHMPLPHKKKQHRFSTIAKKKTYAQKSPVAL
jgi:hypothetical protein